jgi:ornithine--oxo-acid transaminase
MCTQTTKTNILERLQRDGIFETVGGLSAEETLALTNEVCAHNYHPIPVVIARGEGLRVWDKQGREYFDMVGCYSALSHGHLNEAVFAAAREQMRRLTLTSRAVFTSEMAVFLAALCEYCGAEMAVPMNTGTEAVETAIKLARKWAYDVKGVPDGKAEIITAEGNFHGRSISIVAFSTEENYREGFGPFPPGFLTVPFGDAGAIERAITPNTAAMLIEPIQAEGGINVPPDGYLARVRELCRRNNVLLIWDEVQTGFCRTGRRFAWQYENAEPDMMALGKALGGGFMPVSAVVGRRSVLGVFRPGDHGSTFGGNPLASVVGIAGILELLNGRMDERAAELGAFFMERLRPLVGPKVKEVRGKGLLIGMEFHLSAGSGRDYIPKLLEEGILTKDTHAQTLRFAPPLRITREEIEESVQRITRAVG